MKSYLHLEDVYLMEKAAACGRERLLIRLLFRLGCRVSEALAITPADVDFGQARVTILHLKKRIRLSCSKCKAGLGKRHQFCPECGAKTTEAKQRWQEHDRRTKAKPSDSISIKSITKVGTAPPYYRCRLDGGETVLTLTELMTQSKFKRRIAETFNIIPNIGAGTPG